MEKDKKLEKEELKKLELNDEDLDLVVGGVNTFFYYNQNDNSESEAKMPSISPFSK